MKQKVLKKNKNFFKKYFVNSKKVFTFALANLKQTMTEIKVLEEAKEREIFEITIYNQVKKINQSEVNFEWVRQTYNGEFDPGSGWTLAGGLTHASRAVLFLRKWESGVRVRNTCATCLYLGDSLSKGRLILHNILNGIV